MKKEYDFSKGVRGTLMELGNCGLVHRDEKIRKAVDYLVQRHSDGDTAFETHIPVCQDCIDKLNDKDWKLWYCMRCNKSWWIPKNESKKKELYENDEVMWQPFCKYCYGENK